MGSGSSLRPQRDELLKRAHQRELDVIIVWRLDRWGRSLLDLIGTLQELNALGVGFGPLSEALDMTAPSGRVLSQSLFLMNLESCRSLNLWSQFFDFARKTQLCDRTLSKRSSGSV